MQWIKYAFSPDGLKGKFWCGVEVKVHGMTSKSSILLWILNISIYFILFFLILSMVDRIISLKTFFVSKSQSLCFQLLIFTLICTKLSFWMPDYKQSQLWLCWFLQSLWLCCRVFKPIFIAWEIKYIKPPKLLDRAPQKPEDHLLGWKEWATCCPINWLTKTVSCLENFKLVDGVP